MTPKQRPGPDAPAPPAGAPLADLVDDKLNRPLADRVAQEIEEREEESERPRAGADDYARGTAEHEDDRET